MPVLRSMSSPPGSVQPAAEGSTDNAISQPVRVETASSQPVSSPNATQLPVRLLVVDDDGMVLQSTSRLLRSFGYIVVECQSGAHALSLLDHEPFDIVLSDIGMPGIDGIDLLRHVHERDPFVPVILFTGAPDVATAIRALEHGAFRYLPKPVSNDELEKVLERATQLRRFGKLQRYAAGLAGQSRLAVADDELELVFERALDNIWLACQPIVNVRTHKVFGYEALLRSSEPGLANPAVILDAAQRLGRLEQLGRYVRERAAALIPSAPPEALVFVNVHASELGDPLLVDPNAPLSRYAERVVLEITERAPLDSVRDARRRIAALRDLGYRIAVDDLGAGYSGLGTFAQLEPEFVKLDMDLLRDVHVTPTKQKVIRSLASLAREMGMLVVAEGVERREERDTLIELGCELLQGFLFARPERGFSLPPLGP
ncbi:MAG TPA: EAL domain-containing response regulator [Polyangiaceae bacterium]|nr:EAL domain-containing response regulator [Polyangiaceae bacterium]